MDLRPTIIIVSLLATLILVAVIGGLYRLHRTRRRRRMRGNETEEGDVSVRNFVIWKGRVVPDYLKPSGIADRARTWTDRPGWLPRDPTSVNTGKRRQRQPPNGPPTWPISKYNSVRQQNPLRMAAEHSARKHTPGNPREPTRPNTRSDNKLQNKGEATSARTSRPPAISETKARRHRGDLNNSSSTAQVRHLARSLEKAYDVPSPHTRSKVNISTPAIVVTHDSKVNHHHRSKEKQLGNASKYGVNGRAMQSAAPQSTKRRGPPPPTSTSSTLRLPIKPHNKDALQRRKAKGLTSQSPNNTPLASSDTLPTKPPLTSSTRRPLPDFPQPPTTHSTSSQTPRPSRALARSQNTVRRKRHGNPNPTHRPAVKDALNITNPPTTLHTPALGPPTPPRRAAAIESPSNHSRTSSKSLATFASSDISDAYALGRAMPVPIMPTSMSKTVLDLVRGRDKALPSLPVAEDSESGLETDGGRDKSRGLGERSGRGVDTAPRDTIPTSL